MARRGEYRCIEIRIYVSPPESLFGLILVYASIGWTDK